MSEDFHTRMLRIEEELREYEEALSAYSRWMDEWRLRAGDKADADAPLGDWRRL